VPAHLRRERLSFPPSCVPCIMQAFACMMDAVADDLSLVFRALADPTRRQLLDMLRERNGRTLGDLCGALAMARQSASQHLGVLEAANLISTVRHGREKLHYLNPVPLQEISERWIATFEVPRLRALGAVRRAAEEQLVTTPPTYVYVTYVRATPERVWHALTDADLTGRYWGHRNESDWQPGSTWRHVRTDGSGIADVTGTVLESVPPERLVITFGEGAEASRVTFTVEPYQDIVRLTVRHEDVRTEADAEAVAAGWPAVFANLKSLLETGEVLPQAPWEMHAELRAQQMAGDDWR
jgi:uncharacterized protein YndB with AHSA1/START domain/DNA-binding transcriptional ArsR family regulator